MADDSVLSHKYNKTNPSFVNYIKDTTLFIGMELGKHLHLAEVFHNEDRDNNDGRND